MEASAHTFEVAYSATPTEPHSTMTLACVLNFPVKSR